MDTPDNEAWRTHRGHQHGYPGGSRTEFPGLPDSSTTIQPAITDFFVPVGDPPVHPEEAVNDHFEIGPMSITVLIYLYRCAATGAAIYVGQTIQTFAERDREHFGNTRAAPGSFDSIYTDRDMFTHEIIDSQTFEAEIQTRDEYRAFLRRVSEWADAQEIHFIDEHGTYDPHGPGLNRTRGGQGDALRAMLEAMFLRSCERWANEYRPELEAYVSEHKSLHTISRSHPTLGRLIHDVRNVAKSTGHGTYAPPEHMQYMRANGFTLDAHRAYWDLDYRPAFEAWLAEHGTLKYIPRSHPVIGILVHNIRKRPSSIPPEHMDWLRSNGFRWSCTNVAAHVAGYLGMERSNLPADATLNEAVMHCLHEAARMELFGALTVPELVARYNEHRARL